MWGLYCDDCVSVRVGDLLCLCVWAIYCDDCVSVCGGFTVMTILCVCVGIYCDDCVSVCGGFTVMTVTLCVCDLL